MKKTKLILPLMLGMTTLLSLSACNAKMVGSAIVDVTTSASNSCIHPQVSSMLGAVTNLNLVIENGSYIFTKNYTADSKDEQGNVTGKTFDVTYIFTGKAEKVEGNTYNLLPAETCNYTISWGIVSGLFPNATPTQDGTGTEKDDATSLNYFYTPYLKNNKKNDQSMKVTFQKDSLEFDGFSLIEAEEE